MADLPESNEWTPGVYQLETSDPVLGGPEGIDNRQGKQLANRTKWLKDQIEKIVEGVTTIGKAVQLVTARNMKFKGAATGSGSFDGSADIEITLTLADVPWSKINSGKPTTLTGYGIDTATQAEAEAQVDQDNTKPTTALRVFQAIAKKLGLMAQTGLADATVGKLMLVGAGGLMGAVEPFGDPNAIPWRTGHFGATAASVANGPPGASMGDMLFQEVYNVNAAAQHWTCYSSAHKYTRRWNVGTWSAWDEDLTVASVGALITATQPETNSGVNDTKYVTPKKFAAGVAALVIQATEAIKGIAKIATKAQVDSGSGDDVMVTPYKMRFGFVVSFNAQGYVVFPTWLGSLIIQWTSSATIAPGAAGAAYWPIAFPGACLWALAAPLGNAGNGNAGNVVAGGVSTVAVNLYNWGGAISTPARVIGIGV